MINLLSSPSSNSSTLNQVQSLLANGFSEYGFMRIEPFICVYENDNIHVNQLMLICDFFVYSTVTSGFVC